MKDQSIDANVVESGRLEDEELVPLITQDDLREYKELLNAKNLILAEIDKREEAMKAHVKENGDIEGHGVRVYKGVSKKYDRIGAVENALKNNPTIMRIVLAHTKAPKPNVKTAWVQVVKDAEIDLTDYTKKTDVYKISVKD